jgi:hypothetical protein
LKERIRELEGQLQTLSNNCNSSGSNEGYQAPLKRAASLPVDLDPLGQHGGNKNYYNWDFVPTSTTKSDSQMYGPSSSFYFIRQLITYLDAGRHDQELLSIQQSAEESDHHLGDDFSRAREESILRHYWHAYHPVHPILDELGFRNHYDSLWDVSGSYRLPSALVDIMLALCMQYRTTLSGTSSYADSFMESSGSASATRGVFWHRRGQHLLNEELEEPSIRTFQCHLLSVRWLSNAGLQNTAHSVLAIGIRIGIILGLHLEPVAEFPPTERDFRRRLWWTMYATDMKFAMELGRPLAVHISNVTCTLPGDDVHDSQHESRPSLVFNIQFVKLLLATRAIYVTFYRKCGEVLRRTGKKSLYHDPKALEECAGYLVAKVDYLHTWLQKVPKTLKCSRITSDEAAFSTGRSELDFQWLSNNIWARQSVILELLYHNLVMSLYRPFIHFSTQKHLDNPTSESHATSCVNHAITITTTIHQLLTRSTLIDGWIEIFQWQWNAAISLAGYIIAYPTGLLVSIARTTLDTALATFEILSTSMSSAAAAGPKIRELVSKADSIHSRADLATAPQAPVAYTTQSEMPGASFGDINGPDLGNDETTGLFDNTGLEGFQDVLGGASGFNFMSNSFPGFDGFTGDGGTMFDFFNFEETERY